MVTEQFPLGEEDQRAGLRPPQFGTLGLLGFTAAVAVVLSAFQTLGPLPAFVITLFLLAIFAHVAGNFIGTKLRDEGSALSENNPAPITRKQAESHHFAPTTHLSLKKRLGWPTLIVSCCFAIVAAVAGGVLLARVNWDSATFANMTLAVLSCGVLGGLWGFWVCSFAKVALQAWFEALKHESQHVSSTPALDKLLNTHRQGPPHQGPHEPTE